VPVEGAIEARWQVAAIAMPRELLNAYRRRSDCGLSVIVPPDLNSRLTV
jgi:hypothetical protein